MMAALQALESRPVGNIPQRNKSKWWIAAAALITLAAGAAYQWRRHRGYVPDPQAYELYRQGRRDIQEFTEHGFKQSAVDFKNAIARDPEYAAAYAGLADAYSYQASFELERPGIVMPLAESNAAKAIEKDPQTAEAYTSLGIVALAYYWDLPLAEQRFQRSLKLNPRDAFTQHFLGHYYEFAGKWPEAVNQMQRAHDMDRLSPIYGEDLALDMFASGRYENALSQLLETVSLAPDDPLARAVLANVLDALGKSDESLDQAQKAMKLPGMLIVAGNLGGVFCRLGRPDLARGILNQLEAAEKTGTYVAPIEMAMVDFALGDKKNGLLRMREALDDHSFNIGFNIADPVFDQVRQDPEFAAMMNEIHLPPACWRDLPRYRK
jgi:Tfp pilus assembly protein PilF